MLVETYEIQEVDEQPVEVNAECSGLVEELELKGQEKFYNPEEPESADPFCYRKMTAQEKIVIEAVCPKKVKSNIMLMVRFLFVFSRLQHM